MSINLYNYATTDAVYFKVTKDGVGLTGQAPFSTGDIKLSIDGTAFTDIPVGEITEVDSASGLGIYKWQPASGTQTTGEVLIINIKEVVGTNFDENCIIMSTGGNASARFSG